MREILAIADKYSSLENVTVTRESGAISISVVKHDGTKILFTIPENCLEWFVAVHGRDDGKEIFSDWCDHYAVEGESEEQLRSERALEIDNLLREVIEGQLQIFVGQEKGWLPWTTREVFTLSVKRGEEYEQLIPFAPGHTSSQEG